LESAKKAHKIKRTYNTWGLSRTTKELDSSNYVAFKSYFKNRF